MSGSIDERIVDMQFNNKQFEDGIKDTLDSLDNLKKGLGGIDGAGDLSGLSDGISKIADNFTTLGIIAITVLQNIVNRAIDAGVELVKALTLEPLMDGFAEYEIQMNSVKVMMANLGDKATMAQINAALDDLNAYADLTIYNFGEMTDAVGKFTAAGVSLDDSAMAIKGLSNIAAGAGVPANKMKNAYIQVSQALQAGTFRLMDWNSMQNAGLANEEFRNRLLANAKALDGYLIGGKNFRDSLKDGWLTTEVFLATMEEATNQTNDWGKRLYAAATEITTFSQLMQTTKEALGTGWGTSLKLIIGDFEEAKELWTGVSEVLNELIGSTADARNEMLSFWKAHGGREMLIEALANAGKGLIQVMDLIGDAWQTAFPPMTGKQLRALTKDFRNLSERFILSSESADKLKRTFSGLFSAIGLVADIFGFLFSVLGNVVGRLSPVADGFLSVLASSGDFFTALREGVKASQIFEIALTEISAFLDMIEYKVRSSVDVIHEYFNRFSEFDLGEFTVAEAFEIALNKINELLIWIEDKIRLTVNNIRDYFSQFSGFDLGPLTIFSGEVQTQFKPFTSLAEVFKHAINVMVDVWKAAWPYLQEIGKILGTTLSRIGSALKDFSSSIGINTLADVFDPAMLGIIVLGIKKFLDKLSDVLSDAKGFTEGIVDILDGVRGALEAYQTKLKSQALINIAIAIGILAAALLILSTIPAEDMALALAGITVLFAELGAIMLVLSKSMGVVKLSGVAFQMIAMSIAILILSSAMKKLADLDWEQIFKGGVAIFVLSSLLVKTAKSLEQSSGRMITGSIGLVIMAGAILILTKSVEVLGEIDWDSLVKGLVGVGALLGELVLFSKFVDPKGMITVGLATIPLAAGLLILTKSLKTIGDMSWDEIGKGLIGLYGLLMSVGVASLLVDPVRLLAMGVSMIGIGIALNAIAGAMHIVALLSWDEIGKGIIGLAGALFIIGGATRLMNPVTLLAMSVSLLGISAALAAIAGVMKIFGAMSGDEIAKSLLMLSVSIGILAAAAELIGVSGLAGAAALLIMAAALAVLTPSLLVLGAMPLDNIGRALLTLGGVFAIFGLAGLILGPLTPVLLLLSGAIALLGVGVTLLGVGLLAASLAMTTFAAAGAAGTAALVYLVSSLIGLIPMAIGKLGEGLIIFLSLIVESIPLLVEVVTQLVMAFVQIIVRLIPTMVEAIYAFLVKMLDTLLQYIPYLVDAGLQLLLGILQGISQNIAEITVVGLQIISEFLRGIAEGIPGVVQSAVDVVVAFLTSLGQQLPRIIDAGFKMIIDFINGLAEAIRVNTPVLVEAFFNLAGAMIEGLVGGILAGVKGAIDAVIGLGTSLINGFKDIFGINSPSTVMITTAGYIVDGLTIGLENGEGQAATAGEQLATAAEQGVGSSEKSAAIIGSQYGLDFANSLTESLPKVKEAGLALAKAAEEGITTNETAYDQVGTKYGVDFASNLASPEALSAANASGLAIALKAEEGVTYNSTVFAQTGSKYGSDFSNQISSKQIAANVAGKNLAIEAAKGVKANSSEFYRTGQSAGQGFIDGLRSMISAAAEAAADMARAASRAANNALDIHSPSRVFFSSGVFSGLGLVNGLISMTHAVADAGGDLGSAAVDGLRQAINMVTDTVNEDMSTNPTITPVLDLSNIQNGMRSLNRMLNGSTDVTPIANNVNRISSQMGTSNATVGSRETQATAGSSISLTQNNYSPKALSRLEIYRQTKNQFAQLKGLVEES